MLKVGVEMSTGNNTNDQMTEMRALKNSKAFYTAVIFGFIALFWLIILPFLPMTGNGSFFESGFKYFNNYVPGNLIVTISMIPHTIFLLIAGIVLLNKFKTHKAAVVYSFYKLYVVTLFIAFFTWVGFLITGNDNVLFESYGYEYWIYVLLTYIVGLIFVWIGQLATKESHACVFKSRYNTLSWLASIALYFLTLSFSGNVYVRQIFNSVRHSLEDIYSVLEYVFFFIMIKKTFTVIMPVNDCFSFMYGKQLSRGKESEIKKGWNVFGLITTLILALYVIIASAYYELILAGTVALYFILQLVAAKAFNKDAQEQTESLYDFYNSNTAKTTTNNAFNYSPVKTENVSSGVTPTVLPESEIVWNVGRLSSYNSAIIAKEKVPLNEICVDLYAEITNSGMNIEMTELREILSAFASSNLIFIRCGEKALIKRFAEILSEYFNAELFYEKRVVEQPATTKVPATPDLKAIPEVAPVVEVEEVEQQILPTTTENVGETPKQLTDAEIRALNKYGVASGIYVAYHLKDVLNPVFIDNTDVNEVDDFDADILSAVSNKDETIFVGKKKYLETSENYERGSLVVPENLKLVVFVGHEDTEISAHHEWVKYSTVLSLTLTENFNEQQEREKKTITNSVFNQAVEEAQDDNYITEDYWKKIDRLEEYLKDKANITFDNKFLRQVERYAATFLACGATKAETVDAVLANKIIPYIATEKESVLSALESDFSLHLDELFGYENIPLAKSAIKEYGLKI